MLGKDDQRRIVPVTPAAKSALYAYINRERGRGPGPLFYGRGKADSRERITERGIELMIGKTARAVGVPVACHDFRRGACAWMLASGMDFDAVMYIMGHRSPVMTAIYGQEGRRQRAHAALRAVSRRTA